MRNLLCAVFLLLIWNIASAQIPTIQEILKEQKHLRNQVNERDADIYVVDSVYCFQQNQSTGEDIPVSRVYNLELTDMGLVFEQLQQVYDVDNDLWVNDLYTTNTYDGNDDLVESVIEIWDGAGWMNESRILNGLDNNGDIVSVVNQSWNGSDWQNNNRSTFTYNTSGDNDKLVYEIWEDNDWSADFQVFYAYNGDHLLVASIFQKWSETTNNYENVNRIFRSYFAGTGLVSEETAEIWDANLPTPGWVASSRLTFEYDGNGNQLSRLREGWSTVNEIYDNVELIEDGYSSEGENVATITKFWQNNEWVNQGIIEREFDGNGNLLVFRYSYWSGSQWVEASHCDFFYTLTIVDNVVEIDRDLDCKMPNPFSNGQVILCENLPQTEVFDLKIYDLNGQIKIAQSFENQVNVASLSKGIYFFTLQNKGKIVFREKVIVE